MSSQFYEKVVKEKNTPRSTFKKITVIMCYVLIIVIFLFAAFSSLGVGEVGTPTDTSESGSANKPTNNSSAEPNGYFVLIIALGVILDIAVIAITKKYLYKEYEYSFEYGRMSIAKIYGKSKRKQLFETDIETMLMIAPATDEYIAKAEHFEIDKRVIAVSDQKADDIWLVVSGGDGEKRVLAFFDADERSLSILKSANPLSFIKKR